MTAVASYRIVQRFGNHHLGERFGGAVLGELRAGEAAIHADAQARELVEAVEA